MKTEEDSVARAHLLRPITDREGNLLYNATVTVREVNYSIPIGQPLYAGPTGSTTLDNPLTAVNGVIDFWVDTPQRMSILIQHPEVSDILVYLDAPPPPEEIVSSTVPLEIVNAPTVSGQVLLSTSTAGQAQWGNPPTGTGLTPVVVASSQSFSSGGDPSGWGFIQTNGGSHSYDPLSIPPGTNYQYSLRMTQSASNGTVTLTGPTFNLLESGRLSLWIKSSFFTGETFTVKVSDSASVQTTLTTISTTRDWGFYSFDLAAGTYTPIFTYTGQATYADGDHSLWMTGYVAQYGGNVPPHTHSGTGTNSVALGTGASATGTASTAVGVNASATGNNASAYGYGATASGANTLAAGYNTSAPGDYSLAVGSGANGSATSPAWISVGYGATTSGTEAIAMGKNASATSDYAAAVGSGAQAAGASSVAIGQNASAGGLNSVAIGQGAVVGSTHNNSVALGSGATTTSANQIMLGNAGSITTVTGSLQNYGLASLGSPGSRIGFYGSPGNTLQTVSGSDDGNVTVRTLVQALANMGLIVNNTIQQPMSSATPVGIIDYFYHQDPGDGSLGIADFDFAPYVYVPMAFSDQNPYPAGPQWYVSGDHNGYKGYAGGLGVMKNMYNPKHTFAFSTATTGTGNKICLTFRHTGAQGSAASCGYLILDQTAGTISLGTKAAGDPSNVYTVASGNSMSLSTLGLTTFDGARHVHMISVSGTNVMYADTTQGIVTFFQAPALNTTGTYVGLDFAQTTSQFNYLIFWSQSSFDGFMNTGSLSNLASGETWWPILSGTGATASVSAAGNLQLVGATGGYSLAYVLTQATSLAKIVSTRWNSSITPTTSMGIVGRYVDTNNYYFVNNSQITRILNGTQTTLATLSQTFVAGDRMQIIFNATGSIVVYRNGVAIGSATDTTSTLLASNRFGLGMRGAGTAGFQYFWCYDQINGGVTYK